MLRELNKVQQVQGEPLRRWFYDHDLDLVIWQDPQDAIVGFQLAYDKTRDEHSLSWHRERGIKHYVVDDGETSGVTKKAPMLNLNRAADYDWVLDRFLSRSSELPPEIADFVSTTLIDLARVKRDAIIARSGTLERRRDAE